MNKILLTCVGLLFYGCVEPTTPINQNKNLPSNKLIVENEKDGNKKPDPQAYHQCGIDHKRLASDRALCTQTIKYAYANIVIEPRSGYEFTGITRGNDSIKTLNIHNKDALVLYVNTYGVTGSIQTNVRSEIRAEGIHATIIILTKDIIGNMITIRDDKGVLLEYKILK